MRSDIESDRWFLSKSSLASLIQHLAYWGIILIDSESLTRGAHPWDRGKKWCATMWTWSGEVSCFDRDVLHLVLTQINPGIRCCEGAYLWKSADLCMIREYIYKPGFKAPFVQFDSYLGSCSLYPGIPRISNSIKYQSQGVIAPVDFRLFQRSQEAMGLSWPFMAWATSDVHWRQVQNSRRESADVASMQRHLLIM